MEAIELFKGDITRITVEAIVNAANPNLNGGGGVDGAIHKAGGPSIMEQCMKIIHKKGELLTGEAVITQAGDLPAKYVIHTVGPIWGGGKKYEELKLAEAYRSCLNIAIDFNIKEIAFPNISTGAYGFPKNLAAKIAIDEVSNFLTENELMLRVLFVCFDDENYQIYSKMLQ